MSGNDKDNFEFIKEQVIERKSKKIKRIIVPLFTTVCMAILFGMIAAITFVIAEPKINKLLDKEEEEIKTPVIFPTRLPEELNKTEIQNTGSELVDNTPLNQANEDEDVGEEQPEPNPVIVEKSIDADIDDYLKMNEEIRKIAYDVDKALVNISSTFTVEDWFGQSVKTIRTTGLIIYDNNKELLILVSLDKIKDSNSIKISFSDSVEVETVLQDYESELNLAIIAVEKKTIPSNYLSSLKVANLGESYTVTVGSPVIAMGSPNGHPNSMELGMVTSKGSYASITDNRLDLFNTNIRDNGGDGVIVNMKGEVIGLITRTLKEGVNKDLNTVIGISRVKPIIEHMGNQKARIYFGIKAEDMTEAAMTEREITNGIYVNEVQPNSPAFIAGLKNGDVILQIDEQDIVNTYNFNKIITGYEPKTEITVKIKRKNGSSDKEMDLVVTLEEKEK